MDTALIGTMVIREAPSWEIAALSNSLLEWIGGEGEQWKQACGSGFFDLVPPEEKERVEREISEQLKENGRFLTVCRMTFRKGGEARLYIRGTALEYKGERLCFCEVAREQPDYDSDGFYKRLIQLMPNPIIVLDLDLRITYLNEAAEKACRITLEECQGKCCSVFHTPLCGTEECCVERFKRGEGDAVQFTPEGGANRVTISLFYDQEGKPAGYISVSTDITRLMETERQLRLSEERYRLALRQTNNAIWEYDVEKNTVYHSGFLNTDTEEMGALKETPEAMAADGFVHKSSADDLFGMIQEIRGGKKNAGCVLRIKDGEEESRWIEVNCKTVFDQDGKPVHAIGVARDITEEKERERRYVEERQFRDSLISNAVCAYEVNLTQDRMLQVARDWTKMLKISGDAISYDTLFQAVRDQAVYSSYRRYIEEKLERKALIKAFENGKQEIHCEYQRFNSAGSMVWVRASAYMIRSSLTGEICAFIYLKDIDREKKRELELQKKAERDPLTELYNRVTSLSLIEKALEECSGSLCAMFMLDIDNFKQVNDTYGHLFGDGVLTEIAGRLEKCFRRNDVVGRLGGDEFVVFLKNIPEERVALEKARQVCRSLRTIYSSEDQQCQISCSIGISFSPKDGESFKTLYEKADIALYYAKAQGKNRFEVYRDGLTKINLQIKTPRAACLPDGREASLDAVIERIFKTLCHTRDLGASIDEVLSILAGYFRAGRTYIFEYDMEAGSYSMTFEWCQEGVRPEKPWMQALSPEQMGRYWERFDEDGIFCVEDLSREAPGIVTLLKQSGAKASIQCAVVTGSELKGFVGADEYGSTRKFTVEEREMMKAAAQVLSVFLFRKQAEREKEEISNTIEVVMNQMKNVVYVVEPRTKIIVFLNQAASRAFPKASVGGSCHRCIRGLEAPCPDCPVSRILEGRNETGAVPVYDKEANIWLKASASRIKWPDGGNYCMISCTPVT